MTLHSQREQSRGDGASFFRIAIDQSFEKQLPDSYVWPDLIGKTASSLAEMWVTKRADLLLPDVDPSTLDAFKAARKNLARTMPPKHDPNERTLIGIIWLIFRLGDCKPTFGPKGENAPSVFQRTCFDLLERRGHKFRPQHGTEVELEHNEEPFYRRVRENVDALKPRLFQILALTKNLTLSPASAPDTLLAWKQWLLGAPIPTLGG